MAKIVLLLLSLALLDGVLTLTCKRCATYDCSEQEDEDCPLAEAHSASVCLKMEYRDGKTKGRMVDKRCVYRFKNETYKCPGGGYHEILSCQTCDDRDLCNSASQVGSASLAIAGTVVVLYNLL